MLHTQVKPEIHEEWKSLLEDEFRQPYFSALKTFLQDEKQKGKEIFPPGRFVFNAFNLTPPSITKVVILGQDPYHGKGQAHGLSFSVQQNIKRPPSLNNIFKEIKNDIGVESMCKDDLTSWAEQGVLLLNAILTVEANKPASHRQIGWETFTDKVIKQLSSNCNHIVFMLWGKFAGEKSVLIDSDKHLILQSPHPSPFSADRGFFGCKHFTQANHFLEKNGKKPIIW